MVSLVTFDQSLLLFFHHMSRTWASTQQTTKTDRRSEWYTLIIIWIREKIRVCIYTSRLKSLSILGDRCFFKFTFMKECWSQRKHSESHQTLIWFAAVYQREESSDYFERFRIKKWHYIHSRLSIRLQQVTSTASCNIDCWLEVEGKCTILHECKATKSRRRIRRARTGVSGECWVELLTPMQHTDTHNLTSLQLKYCKITLSGCWG